MIKTFLDTSALLHSNIPADASFYISPLTLTELERIKTSREPDDIKFQARAAVRKILAGKGDVITPNNKKIDKMLKKYSFLTNINDHRILCAAEIMAEEIGIDLIFMTCDAS
jgi:hypothetical protein